MPNRPILEHPPEFSYHEALGHRFRVARWRAGERRSQQPLLFFTGLGANLELFAPALERLSGREVITFDMPGIGGTAEYPHPYRLSTMADSAAEILVQLGCRHVDVLGVSWGGMLAQEFAYRHGDKVRRLVLAATSAGALAIPGNPSTLIQMLSSHRYQDPTKIEPYLQKLYGGSSHGLEGYAARMMAPSPTGYFHQLLAILGWTSIRKLTWISAPTLILMGEDDRVLPAANGRILRFLLRDATLHVLPDAGHVFALTHAAMVSPLIEGFLNSPDRPVRAGGQSEAQPASAAAWRRSGGLSGA